jgi:hypothetical protein
MDHSSSLFSDSSPGQRETIESLARRVAALEAHLGLKPDSALKTPRPAIVKEPETTTETTTTDGMSLPAVGQALFVLAGAFLLRAVTESGLLPAQVGVGAGLLYALVLLWLTDRAGRLGRKFRANLYLTAWVLVAFPFMWETTAGLKLVAAPIGAVFLGGLATLALLVAARHGQRAVAWLILLGAEISVCGLYWVLASPGPYLAVAIWLGGLTLWLHDRAGIRGLRWLGAVAGNFLVFVSAVLAAEGAEVAMGRPQPSAGAALVLALLLPSVYLGSFTWKALRRRVELGLFEILQALGSLLAGLVGAMVLLNRTGAGAGSLGAVTLVVAAAAYVLAFRLVRARQGRGLNFFYFAWLGLVLTLMGGMLVLRGPMLSLGWAVLGLLAAETGRRHKRWTLRLHCAAYLLGAAVASGWGYALWHGFLAAGALTWAKVPVAGVAIWLAALLGYALLVGGRQDPDQAGWMHIPRFLVGLLALAGTGFLVVATLHGLFLGRVGGPEPALLAAARTAVLAGAVILCAALSRKARFRELSWLVHPLLVLLGLKVLLEDLRQGTPVSLFIGFVLFGTALITAPRLRRTAPETHASGPPDGAPDANN